MCRFLIAQSDIVFPPQKLLAAFATMAEKSHALDGDWQGDGWGVSWLDSHDNWQQYKSLLPIWKDAEHFSLIPSSRMLSLHARSASFPSQKGVLEYNQPFIYGEYSFVFNGLLKGVTLSSSIPGTIGAQKIWSLLQSFLKKNSPEDALEKVKTVLIKNTKEVQALNIGLSSKKHIYNVNYFTKHPEYYTLHSFQYEEASVICSEKLSFPE